VRRAAVWACADEPGRRAPHQVEHGYGRSATAGTRRILVVDDEPAVRMICRFNLSASGMDVREAGDGDEALEAVREEIPDLLLLDVMMPTRDGWEVAQELRRDPRTRDIPIVFLTALVEHPDRRRAHELGAVGYIAKPFDPIALSTTLEGILERVERGEREQLQQELLESRD
jgi:two-component system phosphate regulon response regulator PhoB